MLHIREVLSVYCIWHKILYYNGDGMREELNILKDFISVTILRSLKYYYQKYKHQRKIKYTIHGKPLA